jgi:hypothetical protein
MKNWIRSSVLIAICCFASIATTASGQEVKFELKTSATMKEVLGENVGKRLALRLASGEEIEGTVTLVGTSLVHISRLAGKEFYDAVVSIDRISAVRMKVRDK